jgi:uncharacterized protein (TIRG00374 family)
VGLSNICVNVENLGWKFIPILLVYPFIFAFDTLGWTYSFPRNFPAHIPWKELYLIRIIGEMLNAIIPFSASLGGEPMKAELLKRRFGIPLSEGYASLLIVHTTFWVSLNIFVIGGILVTSHSLPLTPVLRDSVMAFLIVLGFTAVALITGLHFGIFKKVHEFGEAFKWWGRASEEKKIKFIELDRDIRKFYTENKKNFFISIVWNFLGWFTGTFEVYFIGKAIGLNIGFAEAWLLEALMQVLRIMTFFIPSSVGVQEGGIVLIFSQFGFASGPSLLFALIRRVREILWIALGLILWSLLKDKPNINTGKS